MARKAFLLAVAVLVLCPCGAEGFERLFPGRMDLAVYGIYGKAGPFVRDYNHDGRPDLATTGGSDSVSVFPGNGDGSFSEALHYGVASGIRSMTEGDFNLDGEPDLVSANLDTVSVLLGNGDGTFRPALHSSLGAALQSGIGTADFDGDGNPDLVARWAGGDVVLLLGNGDGTFQAARTYSLKSSPWESLELWAHDTGDLNHDLLPDLVVAGTDYYPRSYVFVLLSSGPGGFSAPIRFEVSGSRYTPAVMIRELSGDSHPDLAMVGEDGAAVLSVLLGNGDGSFQTPVNYPFPYHHRPWSLYAGDFDENGRTDLVVPVRDPSYVAVFFGSGGGAFQDAVQVEVPACPRVAAVEDLDRDGHQDLIVSSESSEASDITVLAGNGDGTFRSAVSYVGRRWPGVPVLEDLNGDDSPDLAVLSTASDALSVFLSNGDGTFEAPGKAASGFLSGVIGLADLNGDGASDLSAVNETADTVSVMLGHGDGSFTLPVDWAAGSSPASLAIGEFNRDSRPDLIVTCGNSTSEPGTVHLFPGNGDGSFQTPASYPVCTDPRSVVIGDLNGDANPDAAVACRASSDVAILLGAPNGIFYETRTVAAGPAASYVAAGDLNGDDSLDLVVVNDGIPPDRPAGVSVLLNNGVGIFVLAGNCLQGAKPRSAAVGDLNLDGRQDLVVARGNEGFSLLLGNGDGSFQGPVDQAGPAYHAVIGDFNGDRLPDLALSNNYGNGVQVLLGNGDGSFLPGRVYGTGRYSAFAAAGDLDGDGRLDLAVADSSDVSILMNIGSGPVCRDTDRDGYGDPADGCAHPELDCDDADPGVNPGMTEVSGNGKDDDCNPGTPSYGTPASVMGTGDEKPSGIANTALIFYPAGLVLFVRALRRRR